MKIMNFEEYLQAKGLLQDYEAIKSNMEEYEEDIRTLDFEHQPRLLEEMRLEIKACRDMIKNYYDEYRKEIEA